MQEDFIRKRKNRYIRERGFYFQDAIKDDLRKYAKEHGDIIFCRTLEELAEIMGISRKSLYNFNKRGIINLNNAITIQDRRGGYSIEKLLEMIETFLKNRRDLLF